MIDQELDRHRAEEALACLDRAGVGSCFRSSISRGHSI